MMIVRKRRRRRRAHRKNPAVPVFVANPRRRRRRRRRRHGGYMRRATHAPRKRRHRRRAHPRALAFRRGNPIRLRRRRRNPLRLSFRSLMGGGLLKMLAFGGLGIVTARIGKYLYNRYVSGMVLGASPGTFRQVVNELASLMAMGAFTWGTNKALKRVVSQDSARWHLVGGMAETGRTGIGLIVKRLVPSVNADAWGLSGQGADLALDQMPALDEYGQPMFGSNVESADYFAGAVEDAESFGAANPMFPQMMGGP